MSVTWVEQGPGPITGGQVLGMAGQGSPVAGAVQAIAAHPTNPDIMLVATVQGGIWKTTNATSSSPTWTPRSDFNQTLAMMDIAYSPIDPQVVYAGTGSFSNGAGDQQAAGVLRSINGGDTWQPLGQISTTAFRIRAIVPTLEVVNGNQVLYAGAVQPNNRLAIDTSVGGLYRSRDGGVTWTKLVNGAVSDMKADPRDLTGRTVYAVQPGLGVIVTTNGGDSWLPVNSSNTTPSFGAIDPAVISASINARLSISNAAGGWRIAVGFVSPAPSSGGSGGSTAPIAQGTGVASGVFISDDPAGSGWTSMGVPADIIGNANMGQQGNRNFALALHPTQVGVVFVAGDRTDDPAVTNGTNGVNNYVGHVMMSDGSGGWLSVVGDSALGTAPHADSRDIEFDAAGHMFEADDGGIYRLLDPTNGGLGRTWVSTNGNIRPTEVNSVAYDSLNNVFFIGNQDTGSAQQSATGSLTWTQFGQGDGNTVGVAHYVGQTVRYLMGNNFDSFKRVTFNSSNQEVAGSEVTLLLASSATPAVRESGVNATDRNFAGFTRIPFQVNPVDPEYLLIGMTGVYTSSNRGDTVTNITPAGMTGQATAVVYGGTVGGSVVRDLAYVGTSRGDVFARFDSGALVTTGFGAAIGSPGTGVGVRDIEVDPDNSRTVYVLDDVSRVWRGTEVGLAGETWTFMLSNFPTLAEGRDLRTIEVYNTTVAPGDETLLVGGNGGGSFGSGVFFTDNPYASSVVWNEFGSNLPNVLVTDLQYNPDDDLLIAGTNGRGVWTVPDAGPDLQARTSYFDVRANAEGSGNATGAGEAFQLVVTARKADGSIDNDFTGTVHFVSSDGSANLPGDASFDQTGLLTPIILDLVNGQAAFTTTLNSVGTQTITVNQVSRPHVTGTGTINVGRAGHTVVWSPHFVYVGTNTILRGDGMSWSQTMNWNVDRLPTADDDVFLGTTPVQLRNLGGAATTIFAGAAGLNIGTGGSLSITGDSTFQTLILEGNSLTSTGNITVNGGTYWGSGTINLPSAGTLNANGGLYVYTENSRSFQQGTINIAGDASFTGGFIGGGGVNASTFTQTGGKWEVSGSAAIGDAKFNFNGGEITGALPLFNSALVIGPASTGAAAFSMRRSSTISGDIAPAQTVLIQSDGGNTATLTAATGFINNGTLTLANVTSSGTSNFIVTNGTLTNASTGVININAGTGGGRTIAANIANSGSFNVNVSGVLSKPNGLFSNLGQVNIAAAAELSFGDSSVFTQSKGKVVITDGGSFVMASDTFNFNGGSVSGTPVLFDSALAIGAGSEGAATFSMRRTSTLSGDIAAAQTILIQSDGGNTATLTAAASFSNSGVISLENVTSSGLSNLVVSKGSLTNAASGVINSNAGTGGGRTINADVINDGAINFNVSTSLIKVNGVLTNNSQVSIAKGAQLDFGGTNTFTQAGGKLTIADDGSFVMNSDTFNFNSGTVIGIPALFDSALVIGPSSTGAATFSTRRSSTLSGDIAAAQKVLVQSDGGNTATLTAAKGFSNFGVLTLENLSSSGSSNLVVASGTLTNALGGVLDINAGTGGGRTISADVINNGTVNFKVETTLTKTDGVFTNNQQVNIATDAVLRIAANGFFTQAAGSLSINGTGAFVMDSDTFNFNGGSVSGTPVLFDSKLNIGALSTGAGSFSMRRSSALSGNIAAAQSVFIQSDGGNTATLTAANSFTNSGTLTLENVTSSGSSNLVVTSGVLTNASNGVINFNFGTGGGRTLSGDVVNNGTVNFNVGATLTKTNGSFTNNSQVNIAPAAALEFGGNGVFTQAGGKLSIDVAGAFVMDGDTFNFNGGSITSTPVLFSSTLNIGANSTGAGTFSMRRTSAISGNIAAAQTVHIQSDGGNPATLTAANSFTNSGTLNLENVTSSGSSNLVVTSGALTNAVGGVINSNAGTGGGRTIDANVINNGTVNFNFGTTLTKTNGVFTNNAQTNIAAGVGVGIATNGVFTQAAGKLSIISDGFLFLDGDTFNFDGGSISGTPIIFGSTLNIGANSTGAGTFLVRRTSAISGNIAAAQTVLVQSDGGNTGTLIAASSFTNSGTLTLENVSSSGSSNLVVTSGTLTNAVGGLINSNVGTGGGRTIDADVVNNGTVNFNMGTTLTKTNGVFTNNAQTNIASGVGLGIAANGVFTQAGGKLAIAEGGSFVLDGDTFNFNGGSISGTPVLFGSALNIGPSSTGAGSFSMRRSSTISGNIAAAQTVLVQSDGGNTATLTAATGFTNAGTLTLENVSSSAASNLVVTSGTLTNAPSGVINLNPSTGGYRVLSTELVNQGVVNSATSAALGRDSADHINTGTLNVTGGELFVSQTGTTPTFTNNGTINISDAQVLTLSGGALTNFNSGTLAGGTYNIGGTFRFPSAAITTNAANVVLTGPASQIVNESNANALVNFARNNAGASFSLQGSRNLTTNGGATEFLNAGSLTIGTGSNFTVNDAKKFTQSAGTTTLNGILTTTNAIGVDIQSGILQGSGDVSGNLQNNGTLNPGGTPGTFDVLGNFVQTAAGVLNVEVVNPTTPQVDLVNVTGSATLDGTLNLIRTNLALPDPIAGVSFNNMTFASRTGSFAHITGRAISNALVFKPTSQTQSLGFTVGTPDAISVAVTAGQLVITDVAGINDNITVTLDTGTNEYVVTSVMPSGTTNTFRRAAAGVTAGVLAFLEDGNDRLDATTLTIPVRAFGFTGRDTLRGGSNNDYFSGEDGDDSLEGFGGNDTLIGGAGNDTATGAGGTDSLVGDAGDDRLLGGGAVDTLEGGPGIDFLSGGASVVSISDQIEGTLTLTNTGYQTTRGDRALVDAGVGNLLGNVTLQGSDLADVIDISTFSGGRVTVLAGGGNDSVLGGANPDVIFGGDGDDTLLGGGGQDQVFGDNGNDIVNGGGASDTVGGGLGNDRIVAGSTAGEANTLREEVDANLTLSTSGGIHTLTGAGTDVLVGLFLAAQLTGGPSANTISAVNFSGPTTLSGGDGNDTLLGSNQLDFLVGGFGADSLVGNAGNDSIFGDDGNDNLSGGAGNDYLRGGTGNDSLDGGADIDRVVEQGNTDVVITGLQLSSPLLGTDTAALVERIEITGGSGANLLDARQSSVQVLLNGGSGNDTLLGSAFPDNINGSSGNDVISGGGGLDTLDGSTGVDILYEVADTNFTVTGLRLTSAATGDETVLRVEGIVLIGGSGNNTLNASKSSVAVTLLGGSGNDTLIGSGLVDVLIGGSRADAAAGIDSIDGGAGADIISADTADVRVADPLDQVIADVLTLLPSWIDAI